MGMNIPNIMHVVNLGIPESCDALVQQNGHAGRDLVSESCAWTYVESAVLAAVDKTIPSNVACQEAESAGICLDSEITSKS
jgi:superfamily II DNA helicase RecQ